ncbi:hypothetical protein STEG23_019406 [Scotinomys teguina]
MLRFLRRTFGRSMQRYARGRGGARAAGLGTSATGAAGPGRRRQLLGAARRARGQRVPGRRRAPAHRRRGCAHIRLWSGQGHPLLPCLPARRNRSERGPAGVLELQIRALLTLLFNVGPERLNSGPDTRTCASLQSIVASVLAFSEANEL